MKNPLRRNLISALAFSAALAALCVDHAYAQQPRARAHGLSLAAEQCADKQLSLTHEAEDAAMGGLRSMKFTLTNVSASACTLKGYPRFVLLNNSGHALPRGRATNGLTRMGDDMKAAPQLVTIAPGKTAEFWIGYLARGAGSMTKPCPSYRRFKITAPGMKQIFIERSSDAIEICSGLEVSPVRLPTEE